MKYIIIALFMLSGCGYSSMNNETLAQVKAVTNETPLMCGNRTDVHLSLGVMKNGVGSMSTHDISGTAYDPSVIATLKTAAETGVLVKVKFNFKRFSFCEWNTEIVGAELD